MVRTKKMVLLLIFAWVISGSMKVYAQPAEYENTSIQAEGFPQTVSLSDENRNTYSVSEENAVVTLMRSDGISSIYIEFDRLPPKWILKDPITGKSITCGENAFLHEYVDVETAFEELPQTLELCFEEGTVVAEIYAFSEGELPKWVQMWKPPCEKADLLLISSHSDDEQLFFSGILPYYAGERGLEVQVAYVVQHFEANQVKNHQRPHEQLDGLWKVGVRNYPVMSDFPDLYAESKDRETAFKQAVSVFESAGITYDDFLDYITESIRRFKPLVVVSHDLDGEYGHGTHVVCSKALTEALVYAADETRYPDSASKYGVWEVEKTYLHLYEENAIVMDFDVPLTAFEGKTAFEVSQEGFGCHKSQHWTWFYKWMYGTEENPIKKAADIKSYSPCNYGLYESKVGMDKAGGDFFENVQTYAEREIIAKMEEQRQFARQIVNCFIEN